ncbi:MAG: hypothetical protein ABIH65_02695 [Nanoarchaeota archaeon]
MKFNFRQISALATSALMLGMTAGLAAAANYPLPFVTSGTPNVAIVYGTGAGVSSLDQVQAGNIQSDLGGFVTGTEVTGGDNVKIEKDFDKLNLGNNAAAVFSSADEEDLTVLLAKGTYTDDENTEYNYEQKVTLGGNLFIKHFSDTDYDDLIGASDNTPVIGIQLNTSQGHVLNYTFDFTTHPAYNAATLETTTMKLMGRNYYVLKVINGTTNKTTFLDSAAGGIATEGETTTIAGKSVSVDIWSSTQVLVTVDGETSNSLNTGGTYKLSDGTYIGIKTIYYDSVTGGGKVDISIGSGKLEVDHGSAVELNDESIEEIIGFLVQDSSEKLDKIVLMWSVDDEEFITPTASLTMPAFGALKISMTEFTFPAQEETTVKGGGSQIEIKTTLKEGAVTIPILGANATGEFNTIGKDSSNRLFTDNTTNTVQKVFNETYGHKYMVVSWNTTTDAESYYLRADVVTEDSVTKARFKNVITGSEKTAALNDVISFGNVEITVTNVTRVSGLLEIFNFTLNSGSSTDVIYTAEGLKIHLPWTNESGSGVLTPAALLPGFVNLTAGTISVAGYFYDNWYLFFDTQNKDNTIGAGDTFNMTLDESGTTTNKVHVQTVTTDSTGLEIESTDDYEYYVIDDLATKIVHATGGDYDSAVVTYHGDQSYANLYLSAPETTTGAGVLGDVLVTDSEVSSVSSKNLIVVGGSCINSVAANLVGGAKCSAAWKDATGVGSGQFLIQSFGDAYSTGKIALLVAGYDAVDTVNAATYLTTKTVDTTAGKKYIGTSSTSATLQVS